MNTDCDVCHWPGGRANPYTWPSVSDAWGGTPGDGCIGCHGRMYGGSADGRGLRLHHVATGTAICGGACHAGDPAPVAESTNPPNDGGSLTNANDACNVGPGYLEDWSGDNAGLDNDGDDLYDTSDPDCASCADVDGDGYSVEGGTCGEIDCDDTADSVHPGAEESCNGIDEDCDGATDEDCIGDGDDGDGNGGGEGFDAAGEGWDAGDDHDAGEPDAQAPGCGCAVPGRTPGGSIVLAIAAVLIALRRRRKE